MPSMSVGFPNRDTMRTEVPGGEGGGGGPMDMNPFMAELLKQAFTKKVTSGQQLPAMAPAAFGQAASGPMTHAEHAFNTVPKKLVHGGNIIPGEQFDTMKMTAAQRQAFLPSGSSIVSPGGGSSSGGSGSGGGSSELFFDPFQGIMRSKNDPYLNINKPKGSNGNF